MSAPKGYSGRVAIVVAAIAIVGAIAVGRPIAEQLATAWRNTRGPATAEEHALALSRALGQNAGDAAGEHAHDEHDHSEGFIELTPQALKNIGFQGVTLAKQEYERTVSLPGMVVERPGRTQLNVAAPLAGVVTRVYVIPGEAVGPHAPLFDVRLTHEELVSAQGEYLKTLEELDVVNREIARLESITEGVVAGSRLRDQKYRRQQLEASLRAQRQALFLHGLSEADVENIVQHRLLLQSLTVKAPPHDDDSNCGDEHMFHVQSLNVQRGQQVDAGAALCVLADHCELYIEGTAFEQDAERIRAAAAAGAEISAHERHRNGDGPLIDGLTILYIADQIDAESRALRFYVTLPNEIDLDRTENGRRFQQWKYKPGQRMELHVPIEVWQNRLVAPAEAVVSEGAEMYVYVEAEPGHFHRTPVHVEYRDQTSAVLADDGSIDAGQVIAGRGAFQIHLALKNQAGGGVDPHAGHSH
ncbi:MAG: secretion protein HlyD [Planctomycetota bacterium]|nr:MAG: secretion protein HlyD [Planctomycetota bacterium]